MLHLRQHIGKFTETLLLVAFMSVTQLANLHFCLYILLRLFGFYFLFLIAKTANSHQQFLIPITLQDFMRHASLIILGEVLKVTDFLQSLPTEHVFTTFELRYAHHLCYIYDTPSYPPFPSSCLQIVLYCNVFNY